MLIGLMSNPLRCHNLLLAISDCEKDTAYAHASRLMIQTVQDHSE
jgi:hypothetical protein